MSDEAAEWRWADSDGAQKAIDEWELVSSLSNGTLPAYTLVWKKGWGDWLQASQVAELAPAMPPGQAEPAVAPKLDSSRTEPPDPPLEKYKARLAREAAAKLLGKPVLTPISVPAAVSSAPPPPPPSVPTSGGGKAAASAALLVGRVGAVAAAPPPPPAPVVIQPPEQPQRPPIPTLIDLADASPTGTLRPPGAVPPPPRAMPPSPPAARMPESLATPLPSVVIADKSEPDQPSTDLRPKTEDSTRDARTQPAASPAPLEAPKEPLPSWSDDDELEHTQPPIAAPRYGRAPPAQPAFSTFVMLALAGIASLLAVVIVVLVMTRARDSTPAAPPIGVAPLPTTSPEPTVSSVPSSACKIVKRPKRVASSISQGVPPYLSSVPGSSRVAVGIATSRTGAAGLTLDAESLDAARTFDEPRGKPVLGVVPLTADGRLSFVVDRDNAPLRFARTVDGKPSFMIGVTDEGFARVVDKQRPETLWPGEGDQKITEPRIAAIPGHGFALGFRRGGQTGQVLAGFLGVDGSRKSELSAVDTRHRFLGTPMVAANDRDVVIAFAARPTETAYWTIQLASARHGELPKGVKDLAIPRGGPGSEAISPAIAGLPDGRWFVQWTEGSSGQRQVRGQVLGTDLAPIGAAVSVSSEDANAGQGVVWVQGDNVVALFLVSKGRGHELWGATLKCK